MTAALAIALFVAVCVGAREHARRRAAERDRDFWRRVATEPHNDADLRAAGFRVVRSVATSRGVVRLLVGGGR